MHDDYRLLCLFFVLPLCLFSRENYLKIVLMPVPVPVPVVLLNEFLQFVHCSVFFAMCSLQCVHCSVFFAVCSLQCDFSPCLSRYVCCSLFVAQCLLFCC